MYVFVIPETRVHCYTRIRYNKYIKNLVRDMSHPEAHLANSVTTDVSARYMSAAVKKEDYDIARDPHHLCLLSLPDRKWRPSRQVINPNPNLTLTLTLTLPPPPRQVIADLRMLGFVVDRSSVTAYKIAHVMGIHFRAGEWGCFPRCGSVFTCKLDGTSYYGRATMFLHVDGCAGSSPGFAVVRWFGKPVYPFGVPLVVHVHDDGSAVDSLFGSVIRVTQMDPSRVTVEHGTDIGEGVFVMRDSGYDVVPTTP